MHIIIEIHEGSIVRNLLENRLLTMLTAQDCKITVVTSAKQVDFFTSKYEGEKIEFIDLGLLDSQKLSCGENYEITIGKHLSKYGFHSLRRFLWNLKTEPNIYRQSTKERVFLKNYSPDIVVSTHLSQMYGRGLVATANQMGIPTIGNLNSWDNVWKGLRMRPKVVTCWSENNKNEICHLEAYRPENVRVIGAPAFDSYLLPEAQWTRLELCNRLNMNPVHPIILFATLGQFKQQIDETNSLEILLNAIDNGAINNLSQIVVRLHPWSHETYFKRLLAHPAVIVSRYENYIPGLGWTPTQEETILAGNLMRLADIVISPGSTMSIEPSIFDTPTIIPIFNNYMPDIYEKYFREVWLNQHFGRILQNNWLPIVHNGPDLISAINRALSDKAWYREGRTSICREILGPLDGKATERFAKCIIDTALNIS